VRIEKYVSRTIQKILVRSKLREQKNKRALNISIFGLCAYLQLMCPSIYKISIKHILHCIHIPSFVVGKPIFTKEKKKISQLPMDIPEDLAGLRHTEHNRLRRKNASRLGAECCHLPQEWLDIDALPAGHGVVIGTGEEFMEASEFVIVMIAIVVNVAVKVVAVAVAAAFTVSVGSSSFRDTVTSTTMLRPAAAAAAIIGAGCHPLTVLYIIF